MGRYRTVITYNHYFEDFLDTLNHKQQMKILQTLRLLEELDVVPSSILKHLEGKKGLYEIRSTFGNDAFRIFCCFDEGRIIVLLGGFQKKTRKTPLREINKAEKIKEQYFIEKNREK